LAAGTTLRARRSSVQKEGAQHLSQTHGRLCGGFQNVFVAERPRRATIVRDAGDHARRDAEFLATG